MCTLKTKNLYLFQNLVFYSRAVLYSHLEKADLMQQMLKDYAMEMENKVKQYPEQWFNHYNFWYN